MQGVSGYRGKEVSQDCVAQHLQECVRSLYKWNKPHNKHVVPCFPDALGRLDDREDVVRVLCLDIVSAVPMYINSEDIDLPETQAFVGHACKMILLHADDSDGDIRKKCIGTNSPQSAISGMPTSNKNSPWRCSGTFQFKPKQNDAYVYPHSAAA